MGYELKSSDPCRPI